ncbi:MAG: hypothetical protein P1U56_17595 [Saprospiraceae bacterium]|nr:hypothetical protein [Saprospiraceae bacterium]
MNDLIKLISEQLEERYPEVEFRIVNKYEMKILPKDDNGFEIFIQQGERENTVHFGAWHFHFNNDEDGINELLDYLGFGMSTLGRLKVYLRSGEEYKWTFEIKNVDDGNWYPAGTMSLMNFKFWEKTILKYYQNDLIEF